MGYGCLLNPVQVDYIIHMPQLINVRRQDPDIYFVGLFRIHTDSRIMVMG